MSVNLLLFKKSNRNSLGRFFVMVAAIMLGIAIVLSYTAGVNAIYQMAYHERVAESVGAPVHLLTKTNRPSDLVVKEVNDPSDTLTTWQNSRIIISKIGRVNGNLDDFMGMKVPKAGTFIASPKLAKILNNNPSLKNRLTSGSLVGTIPDKFLIAPDELAIYEGLGQQEIESSAPGELRAVAPSDVVSYGSFNKAISVSKIILVLIGSITLLIPVMLLIANASELGLAQREKRYAILKLVGATRKQINSSIIFESLIASVIGIIAGSLLYFILRPVYQSNIALGGYHFFLSDISVQPLTYLVIIAITIVLCVVSDLFSLRKIKSSPLGIVKQEKVYKNPRFRSLIPLLLGIALLVVTCLTTRTWVNDHSSEFALIVVAMFVLLMIGLLASGSYITMLIGRFVSHFTKKPVTLLATKRISFMPKRTFRAVGGIVLALFAGCFYLSSVNAVKEYYATGASPDTWHKLNSQTAVISLGSGTKQIDATSGDNKETTTESIAQDNHINSIDKITDDLKKVSGIKNIEKIYADQDIVLPSNSISKYFINYTNVSNKNGFATINFNDANKIKFDQSNSKSPNAIILNFKSDSDLETIRDIVVKNTGGIDNNASFVMDQSYLVDMSTASIIDELSELAYIAIAITIFVSALNIFISTVGGILERKSSFYNLWLCGLDVKQLRISLLIESVMPLILFSVMASVLGYISSKNVIRNISSVNTNVSIPFIYYCIVIGLIGLAVLGIWLISKQLNKVVDANNNQTE